MHKPATAGWNGYGDFQHTTEEAIRMNCRAVADQLTRLVDDADPEVVFLCGEVRSRADVVAELPERVTQRVSQLHAGTRKSHGTEGRCAADGRGVRSPPRHRDDRHR